MKKENRRCCGYACEDCVYFPRFEEDATRIDLNWVFFKTRLPWATYHDYLQAWRKYLAECEKLGIDPIETPKGLRGEKF